MITEEQLIAEMLKVYGDERLQALCEHYPVQFQYILKITHYYLSHAS